MSGPFPPQPGHQDLQALDPSGRLYNTDLAPSEPDSRRWGNYSLFAFWSNTAHNLGAYTFAAGLFILGLNAWEVTVGVLGASVIVYLGCRLSGAMGQTTGVPFPVISRLSWGIYGANVPALIRALAAIGWYGIQTFLASAAINAMLLRFFPSTSGLEHHSFLGLNALSWLSFMFLWAVQLLVLSRGMEVVRHVQGWSGALIWIMMAALGAYMLVATHGKLDLAHGGATLSTGQQVLHTIQIAGLFMGILGTLMLNYADFTRFAPTRRSVAWGTLWGVPVNWTVFALTSVLVSAGSLSLYGKALFDPADIFAKLSNSVLLLFGGVLLIVAALGVNIVANFVSPAFDLANVRPQHIDFRRGGLIAAVLALASLPWKLFSSPVAVNYFLGALGAMIGPLFAIMVVDYYFIRDRKVSIEDLYRPDPSGRYYYIRGVNPVAVAAFVPAAVVSVIVSTVHTFSSAAPFSWYIGVVLGGALYGALARGPLARHLRNALDPEPGAVTVQPESI